MVKCLAQGHKRRNRPGRDSNLHSDNTITESNALDRSATQLHYVNLLFIHILYTHIL